MKLRTFARIAITTSIVLLCTGIAVYSFFKLSAAENKKDFELYTLVPPTTTAVFETDNMAALIQDVDELSCSRDGHFLHISNLFSSLKRYFYALSEEAPHGLSRQMNKVLLSFHEPDNERNQVLYCTLGAGDFELVENFIRKYYSTGFPSKEFDYKGKEIRIYPMPDDDFLACYFTSDFLVASYQKRLVEQVIDAHLSGKSLLKDVAFANIRAGKRNHMPATIYARMHSLDMGKMTDSNPMHTSLGGWTEFDMKLDGDAIYFSGVSHDTDTCMTFMNMLRKQQPHQGFPGAILPVSTFFFSHRSVSDLRSMFDFTAGQAYAASADSSGYVKACNESLLAYFKENGKQDIMTCLFLRNDTAASPAAVASLPVWDTMQAERRLKDLINSAPREEGTTGKSSITYCYTPTRAYPLYMLPRNTLFMQLTGIAQQPTLHTYACLYKGHFLLSSDTESLHTYIRRLDKGEVLEELPDYKESVSGMSDMYNFMLVADLGKMFTQPENYARLVPNFFFRNSDFFRHFVLASQFTCHEGVIYPNVMLLYKDE